MAMGIPVVTTDVAGAKELVDHENTGLVVPQRDVHELAEAMLTILNDQRLHRHMSQAGRERIETSFAFSQRTRRIEDLYEQIVNRTLSA
jgi:glycosyltransferase involved in cell wall biosynthesis